MKNVEILLLQDVNKLGSRGSIARVKSGYARNYLIPKQLGMIATKENIKLWEVQKKRLRAQELERKEELQRVAQELELSSCTIEAKANEDGHLFGSVTYSMIADGFKKVGFEVKADDIQLEDKSLYPVKELGIYTVQVKLHPEVSAKSKVWVVSEQEESE